MQQITTFTSNSKQFINVTLDNGQIVFFYFYYQPAVERWFVNIRWQDKIFNGINITVQPNFMRIYRKNIPFGLMCITQDGLDPVFIDDFSNGRARFFVLNEDEVQQFETTFFEVQS